MQFIGNNIVNTPLVSIIIPCRNEEKFIANSLDSVLANTYSKDKLEILVVDGDSEDKTKEIVQQYSQKYPFIYYYSNPKKIVPTAMNIGILHTKGEYIIRMDAHNEYNIDYIAKIVSWLQKSDADNVGGIWITVPGNDTVKAKAIATVLSHPFGVGNAMFRLGVKEPTYVDTVPFGAYKKDTFVKIGMFDEEFVRNQDDELNLRLVKGGGKILLVPEIVSKYYARTTLTNLWNMYFQYGFWKIKIFKKHKTVATVRQLIPPFFIVSIFFTLGFTLALYLVANFIVSFRESQKQKNLSMLPYMMIGFAALHIGYGTGFIKGIFDFLILGKSKTYEQLTR